ncbi:MerR family transcriptional regulator [Oerskovia flava]|uniref:MerR family transcriptional regulator n=1 Tax=Oerskovia flava TaxID=2986422 RepID=UPI00223ED2D3|nr:MerR family transcriptional regulator [Oerskovia sp. JB1-3-2]
MTTIRSAPEPGGPRPNVPTNPGLAVAVVARRLGVAPATLRTWDRRYGLGPSEHTAGSHRRYTGEDVARLLVMRRLTLEGVAPADAARAALDVGADELADQARQAREAIAPRQRADQSSGAEPGGSPAPSDDRSDPAPTERAGVPGPDRKDTARPGGQASGAVVRPILRAVPGTAPETAPRSARRVVVSDVVDAAIAYDQRSCDQLLRIAEDGDPGEWWSSLVEPALERLAERTVLAGPGEVPEVVLANATLRALREYTQASEDAMVARGGPPRNHPSRMRKIVLVFAAPDEPLPLAAHALAAALGSHGAMVRIVTGPANTHRTLELVAMVRPAAVAMVTTQARPELDLVHATHESNPDLPIFVGLPRDDVVSQLPLAANVHRVRTFTGLLHEVLATVR